MAKRRWFCLSGLVFITLISGLTMVAQAGAATDLLLKRLNEHFVPTVFNQDESDVVAAGTVVTLQKDGLLVFRRPLKYCPISTYKNGKLSQGFGDKVDVAKGDNLGDVNGFNVFPQKILGFGEKFWIDGFGFGKNEILAVVITDPYDDGRYCGMLKFPYEKGHQPTPEDAVRMISEVLAPPAALDKSAPDRGGQLVPGRVNDPIKAIQQRLRDTITLAGLNANGDIATAGSVVTLQKGSLQMCATPNSGAPADAGAPANTYKNGNLSAGMFTWRLGLGISQIDPNTIPMRTYSAGEKFWIVNYKVKENGIEFKLWTDPDSNNIRYWSWLEIPFDKKQIPSADEVMKTVAEVLAVAPAQNQGEQAAPVGPYAAIAGEYIWEIQGWHYIFLPDGSCTYPTFGGTQIQCHFIVEGDWLRVRATVNGMAIGSIKIQGDKLYLNGTIMPSMELVRQGVPPASAPPPEAVAPSAPPAPAPMQAIAPPPPPPDAPPPSIELGQTKDQVTTGFGQPLRIANLGAKTIFYYKDMKVTFTNGKVSNVE